MSLLRRFGDLLIFNISVSSTMVDLAMFYGQIKVINVYKEK